MGKFTRKKNKQVEKVKTRKEVRKQKRTDKKTNRKQYHDNKKYKNGKFVKPPVDTEKDEIKGKKKPIPIDDDEEISSDFELSDIELPDHLDSSKRKKIDVSIDRLKIDQSREKEKRQKLEKEMKSNRITQLKAANEDEDITIKKLEKKLKIDKTKSGKSVPKMFNDGLDYALELCLPENIEKMYTAAKEAHNSDDDDDDFQEDLAIATGKVEEKSKTQKTKKKSKEDAAKKLKLSSKMTKLKEIESKYFSEDDYDSLDEADSEFENENENGDDSDSGSDAEEVPLVKRGKRQRKSSEDEVKPKKGKSVIEKDSDDSEFDLMDSEDDGEDDESDDESDEDDGLDGLTEGLDENSGEDDYGTDASSGKEQEEDTKKEWEDIYGRKRNQDGNVITETTKYVPPHLRKLADAEDDDPKRKEKLMRLKKQLKGYINRLSEANMHKIATDIDGLYMQNSRNDMNNTLTSLITEALISNVLAPERLVLEHALLITVLHANVGSEVGAHFLQKLIQSFDEKLKKIDEYEVENKELDNYVFILCHLYTFKIFQHSLIFEIIKKLSENLSEKSMECVLLVLRSIGFSLRKDDPLALKDLISDLQSKSNEASDELKNNPRLKYMMDVLMAIKNNNTKKMEMYTSNMSDPTLGEHLKKILKSMLVNGKYVTTLNITMEDLLKADERGKWWVVGSAWTGNVKEIGGTNDKQKEESFSEQLLELAKKQRMNTEDRKNVFCTIMSAEDYLDAFEKLLHLSIKDQRVIVSVVIQCCLSEKIFNPYYSTLGEKFCEYDRKYQLSTQYALWDRIKDVKSLNNIQIKNLAQFILHLIQQGAQPISVLKVVEFNELDKPTLRLVRQIILGLLMGKEEVCQQVFERVAPSLKLNSFKDSLRLFMHHFLVKGGTKSGVTSDQMGLLKKRIQIADKALETLDSKINF